LISHRIKTQSKKPFKEGNVRNKQITVAIYTVALICVIAIMSACGSSSPQPTAQPQATVQATSPVPAADGAALVQERCTVCHSLDRIQQAKKTRDQWTQTVTKMISNGANLNAAEQSTLLDYLSKTYGP
jgi:cytochrome c5